MNKIEEGVRKVIADQLGVDPGRIVPEASIGGDLGADSLDIVELVMALEEQFGTEIPDEDTQKIVTVQDVINYVVSRTSEEN